MEMFLFIYILVGIFTFIAAFDEWKLPTGYAEFFEFFLMLVLGVFGWPLILSMVVMSWYGRSVYRQIGFFDETDVDVVASKQAEAVTINKEYR